MEQGEEPPHCVVKLEHIAGCTNKTPGCLSWGDNDLVAMGSSNSVVISKKMIKEGTQTFRSAIKTLNQHTGKVICVKWMHELKSTNIQSETSYLLSGSTDKTIIVWEISFCSKLKQYIYNYCVSLKGHTSTVTSLDGMFFNYENQESKKSIIVSTGVDSTILIWGNLESTNPKDFKLIQKIDLNRSLALAISLNVLPNQTPILACGLDSSRIDLYCMNQQGDGDLFSPVLSLTGHEDWVRGLDFLTIENGDLMLASCSQDGFVRLWKIKRKIDEEVTDVLKIRELAFVSFSQNHEQTYVVHLEAVLAGHEGWVYSVQWNKNDMGRIRLLSSSMDKSIILWEVDDESGIWIEKSRFGEVGGNTLGFYGAVFNRSGIQFMAHSYNGALHLWEEILNEGQSSRWNTGVVMSGHCNHVLDISWEPKHGRYFVSTSLDQTTRLFALWKKGGQDSWHEIARPQIHGYDMQCISMVNSCSFISGADEKVLRVFEAPQNFLQNLETLTGTKLEISHKVLEGATIPALGLSNKAVMSNEISTTNEKSRGEMFIENQFKSLVLQQPPSEEHLLQNSLWPETNKLYWHVYEIFCVACDSSGALVASAAKSATPQHATIVLWSTKSWKEVAQLQGHTLTVTQMEFSNNSKYLLSVSRDRTWMLHKITSDQSNGYSVSIFAKSEKSTCHARIIWSASWTHDDKFFCTGSRDKKIMFWKVNELENQVEETSKKNSVTRILFTAVAEAVTAVAFGNCFTSQTKYQLAIGKESGLLELYLFNGAYNEYECALLYKLSIYDSHSAAVKRIRWRPIGDGSLGQCIATCGEDNLIKVFSINTL
ncbi:elongator complex protein 2-like [Styela clava]